MPEPSETLLEPPTEKAKKKSSSLQRASPRKKTPTPSSKNSPTPAAKPIQNGSQSAPTSRKHKPHPQPTRTPSAEHSGMGGNARQRLESYCVQESKPRPHFGVERLTNGRFKATVYVAKAFGRITGDEKMSKGDAEVDAAAKYLEKLKLT